MTQYHVTHLKNRYGSDRPYDLYYRTDCIDLVRWVMVRDSAGGVFLVEVRGTAQYLGDDSWSLDAIDDFDLEISDIFGKDLSQPEPGLVQAVRENVSFADVPLPLLSQMRHDRLRRDIEVARGLLERTQTKLDKFEKLLDK